MSWTPNAPSAQAAAVQTANQICQALFGAIKANYTSLQALAAANSGLNAALDADAASNPGRMSSADFAACLAVAKGWQNLVVPGSISDSTPTAAITLPS